MTNYTLTKNQMRLLRYAIRIRNRAAPLIVGEDDLPDVEALEEMSLVIVDREQDDVIYWELES